MSSIYDVVITGASGAAPNNGFIDPKTVYSYMENADSTPANYANSLAKSRANHRHKNLIGTLFDNPVMKIVSITPGGSPTSDVAPSNLTVRVEVDGISVVTTRDENNSNAILTGVAAVKRIFARPLIRVSTAVGMEVYDPTQSGAPGNTTQYARTGPRFVAETVGYVYSTLTAAEAAVSVTQVS